MDHYKEKLCLSMYYVLKYINEKMFHQKLTTDLSCNITVTKFPILIDTLKDLSNILLIIRSSLWRALSWSCGSWIYNYLCNKCLLPLKLWVRNSLKRGALSTTLCNNVFRFPLLMKLTPWYSWNIVESGAQNHNPNPILIDTIKDLSNIM